MGSKKMARRAMLALLVLATASAVLASSEGGVNCEKAGKALASTCQAFGEDSDACHTVRLYHTASCKLLIREPVIGESEEKTAPSAKKLAKAVAKAKSKSADKAVKKAEKKLEKKEITKEAAASTAVNSGKMPIKNTMNKKAQHAATRKEDAIKRATSTKNKSAIKVSKKKIIKKKSKAVSKMKAEKKASKANKALRRAKAGKPAKKKVSKKMKKAIKKAVKKKGGSTSSKTSSKAVKAAAKAAGVDHVAMAKRTVRLANEVYSRAQKMCKFDKKVSSKKQAKKEM